MDNQLHLLEDSALVLLCQEQLPYVPNGFEELVRRNQNKVFNLCLRYLSIESDAEDATQEIFMKVFHALPKFDQRSAFTTWLFSIAINHCKTLLAKHRTHNQRYEYGNETAEDNYIDEDENLEEQLLEADEKNCINVAIDKMSGEERDMLLLRFSSELSIDEIAKVLGKKLSATKMSLYRSMEKFKALYEKYCL